MESKAGDENDPDEDRPTSRRRPVITVAVIAAVLAAAAVGGVMVLKKKTKPARTPLVICEEMRASQLTTKCEVKGATFKDIPLKERVEFDVNFAGKLAYGVEVTSFAAMDDMERHQVRSDELQREIVRMTTGTDRGDEERFKLIFVKNMKTMTLAVLMPGANAEEAQDKIAVVRRAVQKE